MIISVPLEDVELSRYDIEDMWNLLTQDPEEFITRTINLIESIDTEYYLPQLRELYDTLKRNL